MREPDDLDDIMRSVLQSDLASQHDARRAWRMTHARIEAGRRRQAFDLLERVLMHASLQRSPIEPLHVWPLEGRLLTLVRFVM